jgi:phosphatidylglycerol lysyltransferase
MPAVDAEHWIRSFADGDLIAASALQPGLQWFSTSFGVLPYRRVAGIDITLGGPLCESGDRAELLRRFLSWSRRPILFYLREPTLALLDGSGLHAAGIGIDRHVDLDALLRAPSKPVRGAIARARRAELELRPLALERLDAPTRARLEQITARYLAHAAVTREMTFLNRPMSYAPDGLRRVFALFERDSGMFGYAVLNPIFADGERKGWLLDILRFEPTKLWGVWFSSVYMLAQLLEREGKGETLSLGFAPLHRVRPAPCSRSKVLQAQVDWMVRYLSTTSYLARLRELKDEIPGSEEPRYLASYTRSLPTVLYAFLGAMGVDVRVLFGPGLVEVLHEGWQLNRPWPRTPTSTIE